MSYGQCVKLIQTGMMNDVLIPVLFRGGLLHLLRLTAEHPPWAEVGSRPAALPALSCSTLSFLSVFSPETNWFFSYLAADWIDHVSFGDVFVLILVSHIFITAHCVVAELLCISAIRRRCLCLTVIWLLCSLNPDGNGVISVTEWQGDQMCKPLHGHMHALLNLLPWSIMAIDKGLKILYKKQT